MKNTHIILFISILASIFFGSCNKNESIIPNNLKINTKSIFSENGRLIFKDSTVFLEHLKWVQENQNTPEVIEEFNKNFGIKSLNSVFYEGLKIENIKKFTDFQQKYSDVFYVHTQDSAEFIDLPCPNILSYIANDKGVYQVGNIVSKTLANNLMVQKYNGEEGVVKLSKLTGNESEIKNSKTFTLNVSQKYYKTAYRDSKHRLVARLKLYEYNSGLELYEASSTSQRKHFGAWFRSNLAGRVGVSYESTKCYKFNNKIYYYSWNGGDSHPVSHQSVTVFTYYLYPIENVNLGLSTCEIIHSGADKSITINNYFDGVSSSW